MGNQSKFPLSQSKSLRNEDNNKKKLEVAWKSSNKDNLKYSSKTLIP